MWLQAAHYAGFRRIEDRSATYIPFVKQLHEQAVSGGQVELENLTPAEYEQRRAAYIRAGKGKPPPGATPLPEEERHD